MKLRNYIKKIITESLNEYKEIEFVCHNSDYSDSTNKESQKKLYQDLKNLQINSNYGILPYMQNFCDERHDELSLAVIILDKNNEHELESNILNLAKINNVELDLYNKRNNKEVDGLIRGDLYDNLITESLKILTIKDALIKRTKEYSIHFKKSIQELNNGLCEEIALDVIEDIGGENKNTFIMDDGWFWDSDKISNIKNSEGYYWNVKNFKKYGMPPFDAKYLSKFYLLGHIWIYHNKKHYDVETLDGVENFWDLPIYKRQIQSLII